MGDILASYQRYLQCLPKHMGSRWTILRWIGSKAFGPLPLNIACKACAGSDSRIWHRVQPPDAPTCGAGTSYLALNFDFVYVDWPSVSVCSSANETSSYAAYRKG